MKYIVNSFSLQMLGGDLGILECTPISKGVFNEEISKGEVKSCIGHEDTAEILGVPFNRENVTIGEDDTLLVAQLVGGRLPEGTKKLPKDYAFMYYRVRFNKNSNRICQLIHDVSVAELEYYTSKVKREKLEDEVTLQVNWDKVNQEREKEGLPPVKNDKQRTAYIRTQVRDLKKEENLKLCEYNNKKMLYENHEIINKGM